MKNQHYKINSSTLSELSEQLKNSKIQEENASLENIAEVDDESDISDVSIPGTSPKKSLQSPKKSLESSPILLDTNKMEDLASEPHDLEEIVLSFSVSLPEKALFSNKLIFQKPDNQICLNFTSLDEPNLQNLDSKPATCE